MRVFQTGRFWERCPLHPVPGERIQPPELGGIADLQVLLYYLAQMTEDTAQSHRFGSLVTTLGASEI